MSNLISWVEIPATDIERAVNFYNKVLNLRLKVMDFGTEKMACFPNGEGAISQAPGFKPSRNGALVSFKAPKDLNSVLELISEHGGEIIQSKTKIEAEGRGFFAIFADTEGNKVGLYED
jgi:uncharacterized protein